MSSYRGEYLPGHPTFPPGSRLQAKQDATPVEITEPDLSWTAEDEKALERYINDNVDTMRHSVRGRVNIDETAANSLTIDRDVRDETPP